MSRLVVSISVPIMSPLCADDKRTSLLILVDLASVPFRRVNTVRQILDRWDDQLQRTYVNALTKELTTRALVLRATGASEGDAATALLTVVQDVYSRMSKHVVICLRTPSTWLQSSRSYPCLFLHNWDFTYMDSHSDGHSSISASNWLKVGCGLQAGLNVSGNRILAALNRDVLKSVVMGVAGMRNNLHFKARPTDPAELQYVAMEAFYMSTQSGLASVAERVHSLERLVDVMGGESLCSLMADRFLALFPKKQLDEQLQVRGTYIFHLYSICVIYRPFVCLCRLLLESAHLERSLRASLQS